MENIKVTNTFESLIKKIISEFWNFSFRRIFLLHIHHNVLKFIVMNNYSYINIMKHSNTMNNGS